MEGVVAHRLEESGFNFNGRDGNRMLVFTWLLEAKSL